jgi:hypothetical protein
MRLELTAIGVGGTRPTVEIDDAPLADGRVQISLDSWPGCEGQGDTVSVTRAEAAAIVAHLQAVFRL